MRVFKIGRLAGVAVLAGAMIVVAGAPVAAIDAPCDPRAVSVSDASAVEGDSYSGRQLNFLVTVTGCFAGTVEYAAVVDLSTPGPPAMANDFTATTGTINWIRANGNAISSVTISVPIVGDDRVEPDEENFTLVLRNPSSTVTIVDDVGVGTIRDDDTTQVGGDSEPDCGMTGVTTCEFVLELSRRVAFDVSVAYATMDGTASSGVEFVGVPNGAVFFPAGAMRATARVTLMPGLMLPSSKYFYVNLTGTSVGTLTISRIRLTIPGP